MNEEKKIAQAILDAQRFHEESYQYGNGERFGCYKLEFDECFKIACKTNGLSSNLWSLLSLANHWLNDIQLWAEDILGIKS